MFSSTIRTLGAMMLMLRDSFTKPENPKLYWRQLMLECASIGVGSLPIVAIISIFLGMVMTIQTAYQLVGPFVPLSIIATTVRESVVLELSPNIMCVVLAGVVGSSMSSELGNMRVSEQIDAYEIMGINTKAYLILPKVIASGIMIPLLILLSIGFALLGGLMAGELAHIIPAEIYVQGLRSGFLGFSILVAVIKAFVFGLSIGIISCYNGYFVSGGSIEIGRASTRAVVVSCTVILAWDYIITALML